MLLDTLCSPDVGTGLVVEQKKIRRALWLSQGRHGLLAEAVSLVVIGEGEVALDGTLLLRDFDSEQILAVTGPNGVTNVCPAIGVTSAV